MRSALIGTHVALSQHQRKPELHLLREREITRHHPNDRHLISIEREQTANDVTVAAETLLPERVTEYYSPWPADTFLFGREGATEKRRDAEHLEDVGADHPGVQLFRFESAGQCRPAVVVGADRVETPALRLPIQKVGRRNRHEPPFCGLAQLHDAILVGEGKRAQQHSVHDAEDCGAGADAEREG